VIMSRRWIALVLTPLMPFGPTFYWQST